MYCWHNRCKRYLHRDEVEVHRELGHQLEAMSPDDDLFEDPPNVSQLRDLEI